MAKNYYYLSTVILSLFIISSCTQVATPTGNEAVYQLNVTVEPTESGNVSPSSRELTEGDEVEISASPNEGWIFDRWQGDHTGTANPDTVTMDRDKDIQALFVKKEYPLTIKYEGEGTVSEQVIQNKKTDYPHGTTVQLTATPATGWVFSHWEGDVETEGNPIQIVIDSERDVTAVFVVREFDLVIQTEGEGNVSERMIQDSSSSYQIVEVMATPSEGWRFVEWKGDVSGSDNPVEITMDREKQVTAVFEEESGENTFNLVVIIQGEGSVNIDPEQDKYESGTPVELTATPSDGWEFDQWEGDLTGTENPASITMESSAEVTALFIEQETAFAGGDGSSGNPYQISNIDELQRVADYLDAHFVQINNIDASVTASWNDGMGFKPIGTNETLFGGTYDGGEFEISGLTINRPSEEYVGLFGNARRATIKNTGLVNVTIVGSRLVGGLVAVIYEGGTIENSYVIGTIRGNSIIGGLTGDMSSTILTDSYTMGDVSGDSSIGGLVGINGQGGRIVNSNSESNVSGISILGGLAGTNSRGGQIEKSYATGDLNGTGDQIGGLVGLVDYTGRITGSHATGIVTGNERIGGLVGDNRGGYIGECYADGAVSGNSMIGGLVGKIIGPGVIDRSHARGNVSGISKLGGLVGSKYATHIDDSYAVGDINGENELGGLAGVSIAGQIQNSYALGRVSGINVVGGLVGVNDTGGYIDVHDAGQIYNSYAHGAVTGEINVGGLVGVNRNHAVITTSYSKGIVSGNDKAGGLVGLNESGIVSSYWDIEATGQNNGVGDGDPNGSAGLITSDMTGDSAETNMPEFDWSSIWIKTTEYPILRWQNENSASN